MNKPAYKIIISGEGGQGVQSLAHAFAVAAFNKGLKVAYMPNYGVEQRGGVSLGFLQISATEIGFPKFSKADIVVVMCERAVERTKQYIGEDTLYIYDSSQIRNDLLHDIKTEKLAIPATELASNKLTPKVFNMILAGALEEEMGTVGLKALEDAFESMFATKYKKHPQLRNMNKKALELGVKEARQAYTVNN